MKERPILMTTESVKAILDGRKSQTRRVVKFKTVDGHRVYKYVYPHPNGGFSFQDFPSPSGISDVVDKIGKLCPYGQVGDRLWVRETIYCNWGGEWRYKADDSLIKDGDFNKGEYFDGDDMSPRPSIFMPRWASRLTLEITEVRVERLQEITAGDCTKEGIPYEDGDYVTMRVFDKFSALWDSINGKKYPWLSNSWVWVIRFDNIGVRVK